MFISAFVTQVPEVQLTPCAWRACFKRNPMNNRVMSLDIHNHQSYMTGLGHQEAGSASLLIPLTNNIWDEEKLQLNVGEGNLHLTIVQPFLSSSERVSLNNFIIHAWAVVKEVSTVIHMCIGYRVMT